MNAKDYQELLKESKDILQEGSSDPKTELAKIKAEEEEENRIADKIAAAKKRQKEYDRIGQEHDRKFYEKYNKKELMEIIRDKLEEVGEIVDNPSIILDKLASFIDDMKNPKSEYHQNRDKRPYEE